ncbi:DUF438 domain-containing protein [Zhaonella formicivorans]|uniref:DUF438 domain-containing protein n=1 Tax=Zhaonella formicivorans TaxID=2528593 RepID=UPI0010E08F27|nr:DUF438 domain-containing protein [Zhaonella formicivorans]
MSELIDGKQKRQEILKGIIRDLHAGQSPESLKERFADLIRNFGPSEIAEMEHQLIAEGMPEQEVKRLCDVHVAVFKSALEQQARPELLPGHPIHTFRKENEAINKVVNSLQEILAQLKASPKASLNDYRQPLTDQLTLLQEINKHYLRKENQLFPMLEKHDVSGPSKVMWQFHDDVRALFKEVNIALANNEKDKFLPALEQLLTTISEMIYKEENILFPMSLEKLSEEEWGRVRIGEEEIGYTLIKPGTEWQPPQGMNAPTVGKDEVSDQLNLDTGSLTAEQINLILTHLPIDITFVDEHGKVSYYSQGRERIFPRSPGIIGRQVQNCHPADSVHIVNKIVEEFKKGTKSSADFWLEINGRFIYIRYFPVRDKTGKYRGIVEVTQDITKIRALQGEKRLLDW